ncbi:hypothetical protein Bacsa_2596 [Phocaeicola salanitronis DSM 18170]|uniref:Uncharacterized protein n=1 Tax=Phocaeicola salanitronis (strain DSM 18170 / JCM 13657 / CCUG 60908 / BL78) TaxID=667015 RepID=F0QZ84_PHOSB|nr:hypothetical protein Bacsa_2596 [Phocaeicola salanitronis DSM 18170]
MTSRMQIIKSPAVRMDNRGFLSSNAETQRLFLREQSTQRVVSGPMSFAL